MTFKISKAIDSPTKVRWDLMRSDDTVVCRSKGSFENEAKARADIAAAKKAMGGVRFAKVEVV